MRETHPTSTQASRPRLRPRRPHPTPPGAPDARTRSQPGVRHGTTPVEVPGRHAESAGRSALSAPAVVYYVPPHRILRGIGTVWGVLPGEPNLLPREGPGRPRSPRPRSALDSFGHFPCVHMQARATRGVIGGRWTHRGLAATASRVSCQLGADRDPPSCAWPVLRIFLGFLLAGWRMGY